MDVHININFSLSYSTTVGTGNGGRGGDPLIVCNDPSTTLVREDDCSITQLTPAITPLVEPDRKSESTLTPMTFAFFATP